MKQRSPTHKDVADCAGVSILTVSRIVDHRPGYADEMRRRVMEAVEDFGYRPYPVAHSLRTRRTRTIALLVSDITNPFFATAASAAWDYAHTFGYSQVLHNTHDGPESEKSYTMAAENLLELSHNEIAHISGPLRQRAARERMEGFQEAIAKRGPHPATCQASLAGGGAANT